MNLCMINGKLKCSSKDEFAFEKKQHPTIRAMDRILRGYPQLSEVRALFHVFACTDQLSIELWSGRQLRTGFMVIVRFLLFQIVTEIIIVACYCSTHSIRGVQKRI